MAAMVAMARLHQQFGDLLGEDLEELAGAVSNLDFHNALLKCHELLEKFSK
jgi:hypothetical protein